MIKILDEQKLCFNQESYFHLKNLEEKNYLVDTIYVLLITMLLSFNKGSQERINHFL